MISLLPLLLGFVIAAGPGPVPTVISTGGDILLVTAAGTIVTAEGTRYLIGNVVLICSLARQT